MSTRRQRSPGLGAVLALLLVLSGCTTVSNVQVSMVNVQFTGLTVFESSAVFTLRVHNANPEPLLLDGAAHKIYLNGLYVGEGLSNEPVEVPRLGFATQRVEVHLNNLSLATRLKPILESKVLDYRLNSVLYARQPAATLRVQNQDRLDLRDFQKTPPSP